MISPYFEELSTKHSGVTFIKVDVDAVEVQLSCKVFCPLLYSQRTQLPQLCDLQTVAQECGISAMPTFQVWKGNQKVDELVGASKDKLQALVEKHV